MICRNLLSVPLSSFGNLSFLDLCARGNCTNLLSLPCCQWLLDEWWHGVLKNLPTTVRLAVRICPLSALVYLEYRARREIRAASAKVKTTETVRPPHLSTRSEDSKLYSHSFPSSKPLTKKDNGVDQHLSRSKHFSRLTIASSTSKHTDSPVTVYDRMMFQYGWDSMPRWNFFLGIWRSPSMKFSLYSLFHLIFLLLFSFVCVYNLHVRITVVELVSLAYVVGYAAEEIRQVVLETIVGEFYEYLTDFWNWIDIVSIGFTGAGFVVRMTVNKTFTSSAHEAYDSRMYLARNLYLIALNLFFMRTLCITSISQIIGPRLKMMADMIRKDLMPLLIVFFIFILSYGIWMQALLHPNNYFQRPSENDPTDIITSDDQRMETPKSLGALFKRAFYSIFEVTVVTEEEVCTSSDTECAHRDGYEIVIYFVLVLYACIVNIILINLLIALFSNTVSRIDQKAKALWLAGRYKMVKEYREKTPLPPPFNTLCIAYEIVVYLVNRCKGCDCKFFCKCCFRKHSPEDTTTGNWTEKWDPMTDSSEEEEEDDYEPKSPVPVREPQMLHMKLIDSRRLEEMKGNRASQKVVKGRELDAFLKFILLQSFSLQDRRYILGSGMSGSSLLNVPTYRSSMLSNFNRRQPDKQLDMNSAMIKVDKRLGNIEDILDRMLSQFDSEHIPVTANFSFAGSSMSPRPLRVPVLTTTPSLTCDYQTSLHVPTSEEMIGDLWTSIKRTKSTSKPTE